MTESVTTQSGTYLLVLRCQCGDEDAFRQLYDQFSTQTLGYLRSVAIEYADDIHQEIWLSVYQRIAELRDPGSFRSWFFRLARHRMIDAMRREKRERELLAVAAEEASGAGFQEVDDVEGNRISLLESAMVQLSAAQREVIYLRYQQQLSYESIAMLVGCSVGTVRSRLHYAKQRLAQAARDE